VFLFAPEILDIESDHSRSYETAIQRIAALIINQLSLLLHTLWLDTKDLVHFLWLPTRPAGGWAMLYFLPFPYPSR
jgi:hypothetical protein